MDQLDFILLSDGERGWAARSNLAATSSAVDTPPAVGRHEMPTTVGFQASLFEQTVAGIDQERSVEIYRESG